MLNQLVQLLRHHQGSDTGWLCVRMKINHNQLRAICKDGIAKKSVKRQKLGRHTYWYTFNHVILTTDRVKTLSPDEQATKSAVTTFAQLNKLMVPRSAAV